jgi:hypothetical protein
MAGEIQLNSTTFATESGGTVTVSNVDSATNRQNLGLEIGVDVQAFDTDTTKNDVANTFTANQTISVTDNTNAALSVTQLGTGYALIVNDEGSETTPFVIDASGNVGIGTSSPSNKLTIQDASNAKIRFNYSDGNEKAFCNFESSGFTFQVGTAGGDPLIMKTNNTERMRIDSSGNLGLANSSNIARIKAQNPISLADDGSINVTTTCGASIVCAYDQGSGEGIACFVTFASTAIVVGQSSNTANSDTDNKLCIFKSAGSHTTTVKNRLGATKNFSISVIGSTSD